MERNDNWRLFLFYPSQRQYLDITNEEKVKALATLETEEEHNTPKRWRNNEASLSAFLGLTR